MAAKTVHCEKLGQELPGLDESTPKGNQALRMCKLLGGPDLARRVHEHISAQAWDLWTDHMRMIVNEFRLDPTRAASDLALLVRAGNPRPGAWFSVHGRRVKVWRAHEAPDEPSLAPGALSRTAELATRHGMLALDEVQPEGKRPMDARAWRAGLRGDARVDE